MANKTKKIRYIFIIYWVLLTYILAILIWWFILLNNQNKQMTFFEMEQVKNSSDNKKESIIRIQDANRRNKLKYIGEGVTFFLLIAAGAVFVFTAVRRQLKISQEQQNFMMALTHELKTPIAVTKLNLETLQKRKLEEVQQQRIIQTTLQEANRLNSLCNNMLLSSQIESSGFRISNEEINLSTLVKDCVQDFVTRYPQRHIKPVLREEVFTVGDHLLLQVAINNLIENAVKYSPKESTVTILLSEEKNTIAVAVKDEGKGIAGSEKKKVFEKFYRIGNSATKAAKGTGLGLYLTKRILLQHNGNIAVTDNSPTGSIFTITLHSSVLKQ